MRVLQIVSQTRRGGAENFALQLSHALLADGHEVRLLATRDNGDLFSMAGDRLPRAACPRTSRWDPRLPGFLVGEIRSFHPDIVHTHNSGPNTWGRAVGLLFPSLKVVCHAHSGRVNWLRPRHTYLEWVLNHRASVVIGVSEEITGRIRARRLIASDRIRFVPAGIDTEPFRRAVADESILPAEARGRPRILHAASLTPVKNHLLLLDAFVRVAKETDAVLLLAGDGALRAAIEERIATLGLAGRVFLLGERADIPELLASSAVSVLPSQAEGLPLAILESMAAGVCPVASRVGGIPTVVEEGRTGILVPPGDREALAAGILRALRDPVCAREMGRAGRSFVEEHYSIRVIARRVEEIYREVLAR